MIRRLVYLLSMVGLACAKSTPVSQEDPNLVRAKEMASAEALPARAEVLLTLNALTAIANGAATSSAASEARFVAGRLLERMFRIEHKKDDATSALSLYEKATNDLSAPSACLAAVNHALLSGDVALDVGTTYTELYRASKRFAKVPACASHIDQELVRLEAWRPSPPVLQAIEHSVNGDALVPAGIDAGGLRATTPSIAKIDQWPGEEAARFVVQLDRPAHFRVGDEALANGKVRTFVELDGVDLGVPAFSRALSGLVSSIRAESTTTGSRVSLEINGKAYRKVFHLPEPYRVVIDIAKLPPGVAKSGVRNVARVALDPGHGGYDPGAKGPNGLSEKDVTLDVARRAAAALVSDGVEALVTREDDHFVTLEERTARANAFSADLFVSIHCNAAESKTKHGIETYVLDTSVNDMAGRVAARENATSAAANAELGAILATMRLADQSTRSVHFAELLQRSAVRSLSAKYPDITDGGVHPAGFHVLVGARMPAVLFESSYISNPNDEQRLQSIEYKQRLADAIVNAIRAYKEGR